MSILVPLRTSPLCTVRHPFPSVATLFRIQRLRFGSSEGVVMSCGATAGVQRAMIHAYNLTDVGIYGGGMIDGRGLYWHFAMRQVRVQH